MTYVIHGSFEITNVSVTDYEAKIYDLCKSYSGENIYVGYENMNMVESNGNCRRHNKFKPRFSGTLEVKFYTNSNVNYTNQQQTEPQTEAYPERIAIEKLCKCLRQLQRNKVIIDMIYDETNNSSLYKSLQLRKMSYSDYESYQSKKRSNTKKSINNTRLRSYTESEVLLLNSLKKKSAGVPSYLEYLNALPNTISSVQKIPLTANNTPISSRASSPDISKSEK